MRISEAVRHAGFFALDALRGGAVRRHIRDIEALLGGDPERTAAVNERRLARLLHHARESTGFYARHQGGAAAALLRDFPVVTKRQISGSYDAFASRAYAGRRLTAVTTSGSYGTPATFHLSRDKAARRRAEVIFFNRWAGYEVGERHAVIRAGTKRGLILLLQNQIPIDSRWIDADRLARFRDVLRRERPSTVIGHPSVMRALARYCGDRGDAPEGFGLRGFVSIGEALDDDGRALIERVFGCMALSRYATEELGVLAHECPEERRHHLNTASYAVELLALDSDRPVPPGEVGRIVVTDFFSHATPLIRYDTGDLGTLADEACPCGRPSPVLATLDGRRIESVYDARGRMVSPFAVSRAMRDLRDVAQFQFIQLADARYDLKLCVKGDYDSEPLIRQKLHDIFGESAHINIIYTDDIPALPSGKRPYVMNMNPRAER
jgi:phenylacetate-CoA ligase